MGELMRSVYIYIYIYIYYMQLELGNNLLIPLLHPLYTYYIKYLEIHTWYIYIGE